MDYGYGQQQIMSLLQELRKDMTTRLDNLERQVDEKFDKLPEVYTTQREHQSLVTTVASIQARQERFDEWRANTVQSQLQTFLGLSQRADDQLVAAASASLSNQTQRDSATTQARATLRAATQAHSTQWILTLSGWGISLLYILLNQLLPHLHWH